MNKNRIITDFTFFFLLAPLRSILIDAFMMRQFRQLPQAIIFDTQALPLAAIKEKPQKDAEDAFDARSVLKISQRDISMNIRGAG